MKSDREQTRSDRGKQTSSLPRPVRQRMEQLAKYKFDRRFVLQLGWF